MAKSPEEKAKAAVIKELKALKVDFNEAASLEDLQGLLESSKAATNADGELGPVPEVELQADKQVAESVSEEESGEKKKKGAKTGLFVVIRRSASAPFEVYSDDLELPAGALLIHPACSEDEACAVMSRQQVHINKR